MLSHRPGVTDNGELSDVGAASQSLLLLHKSSSKCPSPLNYLLPLSFTVCVWSVGVCGRTRGLTVFETGFLSVALGVLELVFLD